MSNVDSLLGRIDAEFDAAKKRIEQFQQDKLTEYQQRQERMATFTSLCDRLREIWKPRLEALAERFGQKVNVTPLVTPSLRQAKFQFQSQLAKIVMTISAMPDSDVRQLVLQYNLDILPILMQFKNTDQMEMPLDKVDEKAVADWIDDRLLDFVKTYLALHEDQHYWTYLKEYQVTDPIANVQFPKYAAATTCEWTGKTYYFIGEQTCEEFREQHGIST
jgi:YHS domain-containing protein